MIKPRCLLSTAPLIWLETKDCFHVLMKVILSGSYPESGGIKNPERLLVMREFMTNNLLIFT